MTPMKPPVEIPTLSTTARKKILITVPEDCSTGKRKQDAINLIYRVEEHDCLSWVESLASDNLGNSGFEVYLVNWDDFSIERENFSSYFYWNENRWVNTTKNGSSGKSLDHLQPSLNLADFHLAWIYKMEKWTDNEKNLSRFFSMLEIVRKHVREVLNDCDTIKHNVDKSLYLSQLEGKVRTIPTAHLHSNNALEDTKFREIVASKGGMVLLKPRIGERSRGQKLCKSLEEVEQLVQVSTNNMEQYMAQPFLLDSVRKNGEISVIFVGDEMIYAVKKYPSNAKTNEKEIPDHRCNVAVGGSIKEHRLSNVEAAYAVKVMEAYKNLGFKLHIARIDFITDEYGPMLMEAEMINPCLYGNLTGNNDMLSRKIASYLHSLT